MSGTEVSLAETADLGPHRTGWDDLVDHSQLPTPFLKSWWLENAAAGSPLFLLCTGPDGQLLGGAAFERDTLSVGPLEVGRLRSPGQGVLAPDHLDILASPGSRRAVVVAVARWLYDCGMVIDLDGLADTCELPGVLGAPILERAPAPYLDLGQIDPEQPLARMPGRLRSTVKRTGKRLARDGFTIRRVDRHSDSTSRADALDTLLLLHDERWRESSALSGAAARLQKTLDAGLEAGGVVVHELADQDRVIASEVELLAGTRACFYQSGRLTDHEFRGSGSVLKDAVLRWSIESGFTEFDLLRGAESYKDDWTDASRDVVRMRCGSKTVASTTANVLNRWIDLAPRVERMRASIARSGDSTAED